MSTDCGLRGLPLLDAVIAQIEANPQTWTQKSYRCRTGMCVAGWVCEMTGGRWLHTLEESRYLSLLEPVDGDSPDDISDGQVHAAERAARLLGLDEDTADNLFDGGNSLAEIKAIRDEIAAMVGEPA